MPLGIIQGGLCFSYAIVSLQLKKHIMRMAIFSRQRKDELTFKPAYLSLSLWKKTLFWIVIG